MRGGDRAGLMFRFGVAAIFLSGLAAPLAVVAQPSDLRAIMSAPIGIERDAPVTTTPLDLRMGKLFVRAEVNGQTREFIFDTGSPTMISRRLADELGLEAVGQNTGTDANGARVTMDVAVVDTVRLGDVTFTHVPVLIFDFDQLGPGACLFDGGVLGSELFPGSAWRIDTEAEILSIAASAEELGGAAPSVRAQLYDFGYPHAPIVDYRVGEISDKALFDTGSAEVVTLFADVAASPSVRAGIPSGSVSRGRGSEGTSAGGAGEITDLVRFDLPGFEIDGQSLGTVRATTRGVPPSLIGAGVLHTGIVTLDYPGQAFLLEPRDAPEAVKPEAGYSIGFSGEGAEVMQLFEGSPAARAGLQLGDEVLRVDGREIGSSADPDCETARWLAERFEPSAAQEVEVRRAGETRTIRIGATRN